MAYRAIYIFVHLFLISTRYLVKRANNLLFWKIRNLFHQFYHIQCQGWQSMIINILYLLSMNEFQCYHTSDGKLHKKCINYDNHS